MKILVSNYFLFKIFLSISSIFCLFVLLIKIIKFNDGNEKINLSFDLIQKELNINLIHSKNCVYITRNDFIQSINQSLNSLELGAYFRPAIVGNKAKYFDVLDKQDLKKKAAIDKMDPKLIPEIDYVEKNGNLEIINEKFDNIYSSHNIEHQVDFIKHLNQIEKLLKPNGRYYLIIPDKRYCFDHFIPETALSEVLDAYYTKRKVHTLHKVLSMCETTHNYANKHWAGEHDEKYNSNLQCYINRLKEFRDKNGGYIDSHNWRFTPENFEFILNSLFKLNLIKLRVETIFCTSNNDLEFKAILKL